MQYLDAEYRLEPVSTAEYMRYAQEFALKQREFGLEGALRLITEGEEPELTDVIMGNSDNIHSAYSGGGYYGFYLGMCLHILRRANPLPETPRIEPQDWDSVMSREKELRERLGVNTLEALGGMGLLEIRDVNDGYVEGYSFTVDSLRLTPFLGLTGLGALHAHDLIHFASVRELE